MSSTPTLHALLINELKDLYHAENQLTKALPKMVKAAQSSKLKSIFSQHLEETRSHITRLAEALKTLEVAVKGKPCHAMLGLIEEAAEAIKLKGPDEVRDAALIGAAQRVEHYEIAGYRTAHALAQVIGETQVARLLAATIKEECGANEKLTKVSVSVNAAALAAGRESPASKPRKK